MMNIDITWLKNIEVWLTYAVIFKVSENLKRSFFHYRVSVFNIILTNGQHISLTFKKSQMPDSFVNYQPQMVQIKYIFSCRNKYLVTSSFFPGNGAILFLFLSTEQIALIYLLLKLKAMYWFEIRNHFTRSHVNILDNALPKLTSWLDSADFPSVSDNKVF